ncbi:MAG: regulatory protein RecX [Bryobacteraceae bacterium]
MARNTRARKLAAEQLFEYAVKCLGVRAYSTGDLKSKLRMRAANPPDVDATIDRLKDIGYLNDQRFAENFASARVENEGFGRMRVLSDLRARRVTGNMAEQSVEQALEGKSEAELIDSYIERRMPSIAAGGRIEDERKLASAYRRLRRAGFTSGPILTALKGLAARPELLEEPIEEEEPEP